MFRSDPAKTAERVQRLARYLDSEVMASSCLGGPLVCRHAAECRASVPGAAFHEAQMSHVGEHYDLSEDGRALRIVVVGQEDGSDHEHVGLLPRRQQVLTRSGRDRAYHKDGALRSRNPHMRGTTSALRLLLGRQAGGDRDGEFIDLASGERVHMFDAFALVNALLCSAHKPRTKNGVSKGPMHENCREHFEATLRELQPTVVIVQGIAVWNWISDLFERVDENNDRYRFDGHDVLVARFAHPSSWGATRWADLSADYLDTTVTPTLNRLRKELLA